MEIGNLNLRYSVVLLWDEEAQVWVAEVPAMDGAATSGETVDEALAMARELIIGRVLVHRDFGELVPSEHAPAQLHQIDISESDIAAVDAGASTSTSSH